MEWRPDEKAHLEAALKHLSRLGDLMEENRNWRFRWMVADAAALLKRLDKEMAPKPPQPAPIEGPDPRLVALIRRKEKRGW